MALDERSLLAVEGIVVAAVDVIRPSPSPAAVSGLAPQRDIIADGPDMVR